MQGDYPYPDTPFERGKWWRHHINVREKTKHQLEGYLEEFSGDWAPSVKAEFRAGYAGSRKPLRPWSKWTA